jgi:hypothetical protein
MRLLAISLAGLVVIFTLPLVVWGGQAALLTLRMVEQLFAHAEHRPELVDALEPGLAGPGVPGTQY